MFLYNFLDKVEIHWAIAYKWICQSMKAVQERAVKMELSDLLVTEEG